MIFWKKFYEIVCKAQFTLLVNLIILETLAWNKKNKN